MHRAMVLRYHVLFDASEVQTVVGAQHRIAPTHVQKC